MTSLPKLVAFDLDDTLAPSKSALPDSIRRALLELPGVTQVCVISGGQVSNYGFKSSIGSAHLLLKWKNDCISCPLAGPSTGGFVKVLSIAFTQKTLQRPRKNQQ